jgi:outer membrane protein OmpA-like peptidoglycan-associated protein
MHRWKQRVWSWAGIAALVTGCATYAPPPRELIDARQAYQHASTSPAVQQGQPQALREAWQALMEAEREYDKDNTSPAARSLAYVALRKAQLAEAQASISVAERQRALAAQSLAQLQDAERRRAEAELRSAQLQLSEAQRLRDEAARLAEARRLEADTAQLRAEAQRQQERRLAAEAQAQQLAQTQAQVETERRAREEAERRAAEALARLEREGEVGVREDARGTVLTLSGSVLFASGQAELLPSARNRLSEVADALKQSNSAITIEGHTDSMGPDAFNEDLSLRRAEQVRGFLLSRGVPPDRLTVRGLGEYRPVASNSTSEGRANNRRVEIVLQRLPTDDSGRTGVGGSGPQDSPP